jgi:fumarate reductase flavoprotein subunit
VVIGGGGSGLAAAVAAAQRGARVTLVEKRRTLGGNSVQALGIFAAESPVQRRLRIDTSKDMCYKLAMEYAHNKINPRLFRAFVNKSGDTVRWLEEQGLKFFDVPYFFPGQVVRTWHCPRGGGTAFINVLMRSCQSLGVRIEMQTRAGDILADKQGKLTGILATSKENKLKIAARGVVIATGGYAGNKKLLEKYFLPGMENIYRIGLPHKGDGLLMAIGIGADTEGLGTLQLIGPGLHDSLTLSYLAKEPNTIWINLKGERFIDESSGLRQFDSLNALMRQPQRICFTLFDDSIRHYLLENGLTSGQGQTYRERRVRPDAWLNDLRAETETGRAFIADSLDEMATFMGVESSRLKTTVDEYNEACGHGYDPIFGKNRSFLKSLHQPPYYAIKCYPNLLTTIGGIKVNEHMQVIGKDDRLIPGLFACGNDTGGWVADTYEINLAGVTFGFAINSGRMAGESAARYTIVNASK